MDRLIILLVLSLVAACATNRTTTDKEPPPTTVSEAIQQSISPLLTRSDPTFSLIIGVSRAGERQFIAYPDQSLMPDSVLRIGSATRPMTALLLATYIEDGSLSYDDPIGVGSCTADQLSAFCFRGAATSFRHLTTHTSGLPAEPDNMTLQYDTGRLQDFLARFQLSIEPGVRFRDSTTGYALLGMALTRHTRTPFEEALQVRVVDPLGLTATTYTPAADALVPGFEGGTQVADPASPPVLWPAAGLASTPSDLLRFLEANLRPGETPALAQAIELTQRASSKISAPRDSLAAPGWLYSEARGIYWHAGSARGYEVFLAFSPATDTAVVLLTNTTLPPQGRLADAGFDLFERLEKLPNSR